MNLRNSRKSSVFHRHCLVYPRIQIIAINDIFIPIIGWPPIVHCCNECFCIAAIFFMKCSWAFCVPFFLVCYLPYLSEGWKDRHHHPFTKKSKLIDNCFTDYKWFQARVLIQYYYSSVQSSSKSDVSSQRYMSTLMNLCFSFSLPTFLFHDLFQVIPSPPLLCNTSGLASILHE